MYVIMAYYHYMNTSAARPRGASASSRTVRPMRVIRYIDGTGR